MELDVFAGQEKSELSMIEVAHEILETTGEVLDFNDLLVRVQEYIGLSEAELDSKMTRFYTNLTAYPLRCVHIYAIISKMCSCTHK